MQSCKKNQKTPQMYTVMKNRMEYSLSSDNSGYLWVLGSKRFFILLNYLSNFLQ